MQARIFIGGLAALHIILGLQNAFADDAIVISTIEGNSPIIEVAQAIIEEVYTKAGLQVEFVVFPGKRAVVNANNGVTDAELLRSVHASVLYKNLLRIDVPIIVLVIEAFSVDMEGPIDSPDDLRGYTVGIRRGATIPTKITEGNVTP